MARILLVEDDRLLRTAMGVSLRRDGHVVVEAADGETAVARGGDADAVLLDLGLPDRDGLAVMAALRATRAVPVVVVTARDGHAEAVAALDAGADDYVTKPFVTEVLLARLRAALRRAAGGPPAADGVVVDLVGRTVLRDGVVVPLTPIERRLLDALAGHPGVLRTRQELLREVWGPAYADETTYLRTYVRQLRAKLGDPADDPRLIATEPGTGYRWIGPAGRRDGAAPPADR